jgi:hypothetical protein
MRIYIECKWFGFLVILWTYYDIVTGKKLPRVVRWRVGKYRNFAKSDFM